MTMTTKELVREALSQGVVTMDKIMAQVGKSETTVRKALKELDAVKSDHGEWTLPADPELVAVLEASLEKAQAKRAAKAEAKPVAGEPKTDRNAARLRDENLVNHLLAGQPMTKAQLAEATGETVSLTYVSIWRLQKAGRIEAVRDGSRTPAYKVV
jgi:ketosteroid isomerase-like protein